MLRKAGALAIVVAVFSWLLAQEGAKKYPFELTIIHVNDNHANHEPQPSGEGGDALQAAVIKQVRGAVRNHITLDAGDRFMGTLFFTEYKGLDNPPFLNGIGFQAMTVGNHEFDEGDEALAALANKINLPLLAANVNVAGSPSLKGKVKPYTILKAGGESIGIIGLLTADTKTGSRPSAAITFDNSYAAVAQKYVDQLTREGINKIVLLTHIGLSDDLKLAANVTGVDAIVGGHSHTLLSKTYREATNTYPMKVNDKDGQPVYIVQAGGGDNRYVGKLDLEFDAQGRVTKAGGDTILLSPYITPDPDIKKEVAVLAKPIDELRKKPVLGKNGKPLLLAIDFPDNKVRDEETLLGDLMADAYRWKGKTEVGLIGGGGLRASLAKGEITYGDVYRVLPFNNKLTTYRLKGVDLQAALEHGVSRFGESGNGRFLQVSGLRFAFDLKRPKGERIRSVEIKQADGTFAMLDVRKEYRVASDNYIRTGGDDFMVLKEKAIDPDEDGPPVQDVFVDYLREIAPVRLMLDGRIRVEK